MTESMDMDTKMQKFDEEIEQILDLLEEKAYFRARDEILKHNEVDIAEILEEILEESGIDKTIIIYRMLPKDISAEVFSYLPSDDQREIIQGITDREVSYIMGELDFDDMIDVLEELPANIVDKILEKTPKEERKLINTFLNYPDTCAGSLMTPEYISLQETMTVGQALQHIRDVGMDSETVYTCYVKKGGRKLEGIVSLRALVIADDDVQVSELMNTEYVYVSVHDDHDGGADDHRRGHFNIPGCACAGDRTGGLYPAFVGYRRKCGNPGRFPDHSRNVHRRDRRQRCLACDVEGISGEHYFRAGSQCHQFREDHSDRRQYADDRTDGIDFDDTGHYFRQTFRRTSADGCQEDRYRPGSHGNSDDLIDHGYGFYFDLFTDGDPYPRAGTLANTLV